MWQGIQGREGELASSPRIQSASRAEQDNSITLQQQCQDMGEAVRAATDDTPDGNAVN